jgi:7-cyano-7-deazaguanine reductase
MGCDQAGQGSRALRGFARGPTLPGMSENTYKTDGTIDTCENAHRERDYEITFTAPEFTSVCQMTGQPDFGTITVTYIPDERCIELRSFKFYLQTFRDRGIFYEDVTNQILTDIVEAVAPRIATVVGEFNTRGGISARVTAEYESAEWIADSEG